MENTPTEQSKQSEINGTDAHGVCAEGKHVASADQSGSSTDDDEVARGDGASPDGESSAAPSSKPHLSKTEKKRRRFEQKRDHKKRRRKEEKARSKKLKKDESAGSDPDGNRDDGAEHVSKRDQVRQVKERQLFGKECGQRICLDLSLEEHMSQKEASRLAQQIGRLYGANKKAEMPAHVILAGVDKAGFLYGECVRKNAGFESYILDVHQEAHTALFPAEEVVYLSPDSANVLESVEHDKVYVIGGLVDETVSKHVTQSRATRAGVTTARLPIDVYMDVDPRAKGSHNKILTINQVFDILLAYAQTRNWRTALPVGVPRRKGYVLRSDI